MAGVYIHIPFCKQLCSYCDFHFSVSLERKQQILDAILREMELRQNESEHTQYQPGHKTLYFGGGTPSVYSAEELDKLATKAAAIYLPEGVDEFTVETNPDDLNDTYLKELLNIGVNRLSIGIQSFIDRDLAWMRRRHSAQQAINSVKQAQQAGFKNITIDLIYGIPAMSLKEWKQNITKALDLGVQHISAYHLTIEPQTILGKEFQRGLFKSIPDEQSEEQFLLLREFLAQKGFVHYEVSNFAAPGYYSKHNSAYWQQKPYIGFGPSAHSYNGKAVRRWNIAHNVKYIEGIESAGNFFEEENLTTVDRFNEYLLTALRTHWGADTGYIWQHFGGALYNYLNKQAAPFLQTGKLVIDKGHMKIPPKHFLVSDGIISSLFKA